MRDRPARVLLIAPQPFFEPRGTPFNVLQMVRALSRGGYDVHLATYSIGEPIEVPGVVIHRSLPLPGIVSVPIGFSGKKLVMDAMLALTAWRLLLTRRFDVVHAVEESIFFTLPLAALRGAPVIYDLDSCISDQLEYTGRVRSRVLLRAIRGLESAALRRSALAITVCRSLTEMVRETARSLPVVQIEDCPVDETLGMADPEAVSRLRHDLGLAGCRVAVYTGNLESYQGIELLFDSVPPLVERCPSARLVLVGGEADQVASARRTLAARGLESFVFLVGKQPPERMAEYMALADALVSPRQHGLNTPLKIFSYMHAGVPIVATDLPTHTQVLDRQTAVLAPADARSFGLALASVLGDPPAFAHLGEAARERVHRDFSREAFARKLLNAYASLAAPRLSKRASSM